jgi:hypothetical protein
MRIFLRTASLIAILATISLYPVPARAQSTPNPFSSFMDKLRQNLASHGLTSGSAQNINGTNVLDTVGLRNILPEYDPDESIAQQYPHVAITVLKSPPHWTAPPITFSGCWTLSAVVWSSASVSKTVGPFDWCMPNDQQIKLGAMAGWGLPNARILNINPHDFTGIHRTNGPRPPYTLLPDDLRTHNLESETGRYVVDSATLYTNTAFGTMFGNLRYGLGADLGSTDNHDFRVWSVSIN